MPNCLSKEYAMNDKILIVDDERDICEILEFNLMKEGYNVECAYSAEEPLKALTPEKDHVFKERMRTGVYLNALRAVFGFAHTCHQTQGGEWENVYLDIPRNFLFNPTKETCQWLYTTMKRAKTQLYITEGFWLV